MKREKEKGTARKEKDQKCLPFYISSTNSQMIFSMMIIAAMQEGDEINIGNSAGSSSMIMKQLENALGKENVHTNPLFFLYLW